jgi:uncharacterized protein
MPLLAVPANDVDASGLAVDVALPVAWLNSELADAGASAAAPGRLTARLSRSGAADVIVRGRVQAGLTVPCARCLAPAAVQVGAELSLLLQPVKAAAPGPQRPRAGNGGKAAPKGAPKGKGKGKDPEYEFLAGEADVDTYDGETVVLDQFVREAILLEMPNFPLCSEACPGIGRDARPAGELAVPADPRLAPLGALRDRLAQKKKTKKE